VFAGSARVQRGATDVVAAPLLEESIRVSCLSPGEAVRIARELGASAVRMDDAQAPGTLIVRATAVELQGMRSFFESYERGPACESRATQPGT